MRKSVLLTGGAAVFFALALLGCAIFSHANKKQETETAGHSADISSNVNTMPVVIAPMIANPTSNGQTHNRLYLGPKAFALQMSLPEYDTDALSYIDSRLDRARGGDAQASYEIHARVSSCARSLAPGDEDEYKAYASVGLGEQFSKRVELDIERCKGLIHRADVTSENWLSTSAAQGSIEARLMYARMPEAAIGDHQNIPTDLAKVTDYRKNVIDYLQDSTELGNLDSMESLANIYDRGIISPQSPEKSLGYWIALEMANPSEHSRTSIKRLTDQLHPGQLQNARAAAKDIYSTCCK